MCPPTFGIGLLKQVSHAYCCVPFGQSSAKPDLLCLSVCLSVGAWTVCDCLASWLPCNLQLRPCSVRGTDACTDLLEQVDLLDLFELLKE